MDLDKFLAAELSPRTATIAVPELKSFFGKDPAEWVVRGLTGVEMGRVRQETSVGQDNVKALIEALAGAGDKAEALRKTMGISDDEVPQDVSMRIALLTAGSVSPALGVDMRDVAVKIATAYPTTFYNITQQILTLTGQGHELGKPKRSGKTQK